MSNEGLFQRAISGASSGVVTAIQEAANRTGVDFSALLQTAHVESRLNPMAKAATSSAAGLFQFIDSTWLSTLRRHGAKHGLVPANRQEAMALRNDPLAASLMAAEHMGDNVRYLQQHLGRAIGVTDAYLAHFLGAGGAKDFLARMAQAPSEKADALFPSAARANPSIFYSKGVARSLEQIHDLFSRKLGAAEMDPIAPSPAITNAGIVTDDRVLGTANLLEATLPPVATARLAYLLLAELGG